MASYSRILLLALIALTVIGLLTATQAKAQDDDDEDDIPRGEAHDGEVPEDPKVNMDDADEDEEPDALPEEEDELEEGITGLSAKTVFLGDAVSEKFPAGEWVDSLVAFDNADDSAKYVVRFAAAHLSAVGDANQFIQNFTGNQYDREVGPHETSTFKYRFKPHESLDARDYNLVIRVFFMTADNQTMVIAGHNATITITDPLGTDPEMIMTFVTIAAIAAGVVYYFQNIRKPKTRRPAKGTTSSVEMGTGSSYNAEYVSAEHIRYSQEMNSKSPKRGSSKPKTA